jgi:hypothetical protein
LPEVELSSVDAASPMEALERDLLRVPGVEAARIVAGSTGRVAEVHVVSAGDRAPKQIVRDVQSVALAGFGIEIDYRTVSVVHLEEGRVSPNATPAPVVTPRTRLIGVVTNLDGARGSATVRLSSWGEERSGQSRGAARSMYRLVAEAALEALDDEKTLAVAEIESVDVLAVGAKTVAVVLLRLTGEGDPKTLVGSALVRSEPNQAVARAVLAGLNRLAPTR